MFLHVKKNTNPVNGRPFAEATKLLSRTQLAERWQVSGMSLKRYETRGIIKPIKLAARVVRYRLAEIEAYEQEATLDRRVTA